jgi:hypothetical protein
MVTRDPVFRVFREKRRKFLLGDHQRSIAKR